MAKTKAPTPQELYRARKQREEQEKLAFLPPGLLNHGNTCFMNSVLQGLMATRLLSLLVHSAPIPPAIQAHSATLLASQRSPQLTNVDNNWGVPMPIGEAFLGVMKRAWDAEYGRRRENLSPRALLTALGKKYDQYLDFAQQDAHEFLRIILDAMSMEELDAIKKSQPPAPNPPPKKRRRVSLPKPADDAPMSLADMIFGGKLTSVLVCQKCKHVSHTYEDFNDLSLSIKSEDYQSGNRKRDRFRSFAKKLGVSLGNGSGSSASSEASGPFPLLRASSVPPSPRERPDGFGELVAAATATEDPRRRSLDLPPEEAKPDTNDEQPVRVNHEQPARVNGVSLVVSQDDRHIEFVDQAKPPADAKKDKDKEKDGDAWTKLSRRLSLGLGTKSSKDRERKGRSMERVSRDLTYAALMGSKPGSDSTTTTPRTSTSDPAPEIRLSRASNDSAGTATPKSRPVTPSASPDAISRSKSPKLPKPTSGETAYLRQILADVATGGGAGDSAAAFLKLGGGLPGVEECLRMFTAVEVLDGDNMVGCRRCWKIANGQYVPRVRSPAEDEADSEDSADVEDSDSPRTPAPSQPIPIAIVAPHPQRPPLLPSLSTPLIGSMYARNDELASDALASVASLPLRPRSSTSSSRETPLSSASSVHSLAMSSSTSTWTSDQVDTPAVTGTQVTVVPPTPGTGASSFTNGRGRGAEVDVVVTESDGRVVAGSLDAIAEGEGGQRVRISVEGKGANANAPGLHPPRPHHRRHVSEESGSGASTDGSSGSGDEDESDVSAASVSSASASATASGSAPSAASPSQDSAANSKILPKPKKPKPKPKPVIMRPAYKRYLIASPPPVLVIHLKRFQQVSKNALSLSFSSGFKKLDEYVTFPERLDLTPFLAPRREDYGLGLRRRGTGTGAGRFGGLGSGKSQKERCMYRLYAVVVHIGNMLGGHYIAYVALPTPEDAASMAPPPAPTTPQSDTALPPSSTSDNLKEKKEEAPPRQWAYISDTVVRLTTLEEVLKAKAYICMYERV
ncbi:USP domain-containing protein [Mycena kentingensis (nom. inval.)]|nr:USP domain-containing protein [Mycena kentingensis (nom. inval.)]